jgi:septal ring factor EnvC (AmiA/AmiB activator)
MTKLLTLLSLTFYFFALLFGLILFTGRFPQPVSGQEGQSETSAEQMVPLETKLQELNKEIESKQARLSKLQEEIAKAKKTINQLKGQITALEIEKNSLDRGRSLARLYGSMQAEDVASIITKANDETIDLIVKYAFPYMKDRDLGKVMGSLVKTDPQLAAKIIKMMAKNDGEERTEELEGEKNI